MASQLLERDKKISQSCLCKPFGVIKKSYYYRRQTKHIYLKTVKVKALIRQIFNDSNRTVGTRSIVAILINEYDSKLSHYMASKIMHTTAD